MAHFIYTCPACKQVFEDASTQLIYEHIAHHIMAQPVKKEYGKKNLARQGKGKVRSSKGRKKG